MLYVILKWFWARCAQLSGHLATSCQAITSLAANAHLPYEAPTPARKPGLDCTCRSRSATTGCWSWQTSSVHYWWSRCLTLVPLTRRKSISWCSGQSRAWSGASSVPARRSVSICLCLWSLGWKSAGTSLFVLSRSIAKYRGSNKFELCTSYRRRLAWWTRRPCPSCWSVLS